MDFLDYAVKLQDTVNAVTRVIGKLLHVNNMVAPVAVPVVDVIHTDKTDRDGVVVKSEDKVKNTLSAPRLNDRGLGKTERTGATILPVPSAWIVYASTPDLLLAALAAGILAAIYPSKAAAAFRADLCISKNKASKLFEFAFPAGFGLPPAWQELVNGESAYTLAQELCQNRDSILAFLNKGELKPPTRWTHECAGDNKRKKPDQHDSALRAEKFCRLHKDDTCAVCGGPMTFWAVEREWAFNDEGNLAPKEQPQPVVHTHAA